MVHFELATPLGIAVSDRDADQVVQELARTGRFDQLNRPTIEQVMRTLLRDGALQQGSGRWVSGRPDPADFVPGDVAAIRAIVADPIIWAAGAVSLYRRRGGRLEPMVSYHDTVAPAAPGAELLLSLDPARVLNEPVLACLLVELGSAVAYFIPTAPPRRCWQAAHHTPASTGTCACRSRRSWCCSAPTSPSTRPASPGRLRSRSSSFPASTRWTTWSTVAATSPGWSCSPTPTGGCATT
jgi:hypothetical protein